MRRALWYGVNPLGVSVWAREHVCGRTCTCGAKWPVAGLTWGFSDAEERGRTARPIGLGTGTAQEWTPAPPARNARPPAQAGQQSRFPLAPRTRAHTHGPFRLGCPETLRGPSRLRSGHSGPPRVTTEAA